MSKAIVVLDSTVAVFEWRPFRSHDQHWWSTSFRIVSFHVHNGSGVAAQSASEESRSYSVAVN